MNSISLRFKEVLEYLTSSGEVSNNKDFASKIGISTSMITEICKGRSNVGSLTLQNIVLAFPIINALWLLTGIGSMLQKTRNNHKLKCKNCRSNPRLKILFTIICIKKKKQKTKSW